MHEFRPFSTAHAAILLALVALVALAVGARRRATSDLARRGIDFMFGLANLAWWVLASALQVREWDWSRSLPIQVCDLSAILAAVAMLHGVRWSRAGLYYVGLGLSIWALLTPDLRDGPSRLQFWIFFLGHGATCGAAVYDLLGRGFRPTWRDFALAVGLMTAWLTVVLPLNAIYGWNYGYVGNALSETTNPIHFLGPWPWRVFGLAAGVIAFFALMTLPWRRPQSPP